MILKHFVALAPDMSQRIKRAQLDVGRCIQHARHWLHSQPQRLLPSRYTKGHFEIYADGSYRAGYGGGYGVVILNRGRIIHQIIGHIPGEWPSQQTMSEFAAVRAGIRWCERQQATDIKVYYDCMGISHSAARVNHKSNRKQSDLYTSYHKFMHPRVLGESKCKVSLHKVPAHEGNVLNNQADRLAKLGLYKIKPEWLSDPAWRKPRRLLTADAQRDLSLPKNFPRKLPISQAVCRRLARIIPHLLQAPIEVRYV